MPLEKLTQFTKKVADLEDKPNATMTAAEVKAQFDAAPEEVRVYVNKLIDVLQSETDGDSGADNIKATTVDGLNGNTVQTLLESLKKLDDTNRTYLLSQIQGATLGQIPDGTITDLKLSDAEGQIKQEFMSHQANDVTQETVHGIRIEHGETWIPNGTTGWVEVSVFFIKPFSNNNVHVVANLIASPTERLKAGGLHIVKSSITNTGFKVAVDLGEGSMSGNFSWIAIGN